MQVCMRAQIFILLDFFMHARSCVVFYVVFPALLIRSGKLELFFVIVAFCSLSLPP